MTCVLSLAEMSAPLSCQGLLSSDFYIWLLIFQVWVSTPKTQQEAAMGNGEGPQLLGLAQGDRATTERCPKSSTTSVTPRADSIIPTGIRSRSWHVPGMRQEGLDPHRELACRLPAVPHR